MMSAEAVGQPNLALTEDTTKLAEIIPLREITPENLREPTEIDRISEAITWWLQATTVADRDNNSHTDTPQLANLIVETTATKEPGNLPPEAAAHRLHLVDIVRDIDIFTDYDERVATEGSVYEAVARFQATTKAPRSLLEELATERKAAIAILTLAAAVESQPDTDTRQSVRESLRAIIEEFETRAEEIRIAQHAAATAAAQKPVTKRRSPPRRR